MPAPIPYNTARIANSVYYSRKICFTRALPLLLFLFALLATSCNDKAKEQKQHTRSFSEEEKLYRSYVDAALSHKSDSFLNRLDTIMPATFRDDYRIIAYRQFLQGFRAYKRDETDTARQLFSSMLQYAKIDSARDFDLITLKQTGLLRVEMAGGVNSGTFILLLPILELNDKPDHQSRYLWWTYNLAAEAWFRVGDLDKSEQFINRSVKALPDTTDYSLRAQFMAQHSRIESTRENFRKALLYEDSVYALATKAGDQKMLATCIAAKGVLYIRMGDRVKGYALQSEAFELKKKLGNDMTGEYLNMAFTHLDEKNFEKALYYGQQVLSLANQKKDEEHISLGNEVISKAYKEMKQYDSAFYYMISAFNAKLRLSASQQNKEIAALELNYILKQQKQQTKDLVTKNKAQGTILKQQRILIFAFGISLLLSLLLAYVFMRQRRLRAANESMELEQRLLRSQMDPHFIFNTLSSLQGFIRNNENERSIRYLNQFARLLRLSLENSREAFVPLQQEVEALKNYLSLQYMRFEDLFSYHIHLYEDYDEDEILIPPMLIQPFVENAIQHGVQNLHTKGMIQVNIDKTNGILRCTIEDNGKGIQQKTSDPEKRSLSTFITRERLEILAKKTGKKADLKIIDKEAEAKGTGILVIIDIPYIAASAYRQPA